MAVQIPLSAAFVDPSYGKANTLFPAVSNYSDGRILILILTAVLCGVVSVITLTGWLPEWSARFDAFTSRFEVFASSEDAVRPTYKRSKFGAWMTLLGGLLAIGLLGDVLIQFSDEFWYENSYTIPSIDNSPLQATSGRVELYLTATRAAGVSSPCIITQLAVNGYITGSFQLTRSQQSTGTQTDPNAVQCAFTLVHPAFQLAPPVYPTTPLAAQPTLVVGLGPNLQVTAWSIRVNDAKAGAYTSAAPPDTTALAFNSSTGRTHTIAALMTTSRYTDRTYFSTPTGAVTTAYRAAFMSYSLAPSVTSQLQDYMVFTFQLNTAILSTDRSPRLSILQLLGILFGLALGLLALMKLVHDAADIAFDATIISARDARACLCCRTRESSKAVLSAATPARARSERFVDALGRPVSSRLIPYAAPARRGSEVAPARPLSASLRNFDSLMASTGTGMLPQRSPLARMQSRMDATAPTDPASQPLKRVQSSWVGNPITSSIPVSSSAANDGFVVPPPPPPATLPDESFGATRTGFTGAIAQPAAARAKPSGPGRKPLSSSAGTFVASPAPTPSVNASSTNSVFAGRNPLKPASALPSPEAAYTPTIGLSATGVAGGNNAGVAAAIMALRSQFEHK